MESGGGKLNFTMGLDLTALRTDADEALKVLGRIGGEASRQGAVMDKAMGSAGMAGTFTVLEAAVRGAATQIEGLEFGSAQEKIGALSYIIQQNEAATAEATATLDRYRAEAKEAFERGDDAALQSLSSEMEDQINKIAELTERTAGYRAEMEGMMEMAGAGSTGNAAPIRLYDSEADIAAVDAMEKRVVDLSAEIARVGASGGDTSALTAELSKTRDGLNAMREEASAAASVLGSDLGGRASEAQQLLHKLNAAVEEQQGTIATLSSMLEEASAEYDRLRESETATSDEVERAAAAHDELAQRLSEAKEELSALQGAQQTAQRQWEAVSQEVKVHDSAIVKMCGGYENYQQMLGMLPGPVQKVVGGIQGMTSASMKFIATPVGATIAAITLALKALTTWFHSSSEGQKAFAKVTGIVNGVLGQLKEIVIKVGNAIYKAFTDPKQALQDFVEALKTNVVNRFQAVGKVGAAVGKIIKSAFSKDGWSGVKEGLSDLGNGIAQFYTGVEDVSGKIKEWAANVTDAATESAAIKSESRELELEVSKWQVRKQELDKAKAEASARMYDSSASAAERQAALEDYKAALQEELDAEQRFADKRVELQERSMALTTNGDEDYEKLYSLQAAAKAVETQGAQELAALQRRANSINRAITTEAGGVESAEQERAKAFEKAGETLAALILSNNQSELSAMEEGETKRMAVLKAQRAKREAEIEATVEQFRRLNEKTGEETGEDGLTETQSGEILRARTNIEREYQNGIKAILQDELSDIMTYEQKRQQVEEEYAARREALYTTDESGNRTLKEGVEQGNADELERQAQEALEAVDEQFAMREDEYQEWCEDLSSMTLDQLGKVLEQAQAALDLAKASGTSGNQLATAQAKVTKAQKEYNAAKKEADKENKDSKSDNKRAIEEWNDLRESLNDCASAFSELGDAIGGTVGDALSAVGQVSSQTVSMINSIVQLVSISTSAMEATSATGVSAIKAVETASVILTIISTVVQVATTIAGLFDENAAIQEDIDNLDAEIQKLQWMMDNPDIGRLESQYGDLVDYVESEIEKVMGKHTSTKTNFLDLNPRTFTDTATVLKNNAVTAKKAVDELTQSILDVGYSATKSIGADKWNLKDTVDNYSEQILALKAEIEEEESKSKKKKDEDAIEKDKEQLEETYAEAAEYIADAFDDIIGDTADNIAQTLGDAFFDAFQSGEDAAAAWSDSVDDIIASMLKNMFIQQYIQPKITDWYNDYMSKLFGDDAETDFEEVAALEDEMRDTLNDIVSEFQDSWSEYQSLFDDLYEDTREASSKGIAQASQETVDELNGRATAIQGHTYSINENTKELVSTSNLILQSIVNIETDTSSLASAASDIRTGVTYLRSAVDDISSKGVKIRS